MLYPKGIAVPYLLFFSLCLFMTSCIVPVNTSLESARTIGAGKIEATASYASYSATAEGESATINNNLGLRVGVGVSDRFDLKVRYIRLMSQLGDGDESPDVNYLSIAPKFSLSENRWAITVPGGLYFATVDGEAESTWFASPRIIFTHPFPNDKVELSASGKVDIYFEEDAEPAVGFTIGGGFSSDLTKWAIRPEIGFLFNTESDAETSSVHFGIGGTIIFGGN